MSDYQSCKAGFLSDARKEAIYAEDKGRTSIINDATSIPMIIPVCISLAIIGFGAMYIFFN